jgi:hypothetical protein
MKFPSTRDRIWIVSEVGRVVEDYEEWVTSHKVWSVLVRTTRGSMIIRYLRGNYVVFESLCKTRLVNCQRQRCHSIFL